ncbi:hypothetical protein NP493_82g05009 [Ridgeia piscesae]|uniref:Uncharacterized protein n=1 Tax=Ridgeia piscesae TaxID=27915 RepID=A0AAD9P918_RIDPI|nr:hypothetical protein NP493_82g05009 [Ridgeia piscesae]
MMLITYDLNHYNVSETSNAQRLVQYIVNKDRVTAVSDALEVVKAYSEMTEDTVYLTRLTYLIDHGRQEESLTLLKSLPPVLQVKCGKQLVIGTSLLIHNDYIVFNQQETNRKRLLHTSSSCDILQHLLTLDLAADEQEDFEELLSNLQNIRVLQVEFGEFVSYEDYCNDEKRQRQCKKWLSQRQACVTDKSHCQTRDFGDRKPGLTIPSGHSIYRLAHVVGVKEAVLCGQLAVDAIEEGRMDTALHWCRLLCRHLPTQETARVMFDVAGRLCSLLDSQQHNEAFTDLPCLVTQLASAALTHCSADLLADCLRLCTTTSLANDVLQQCHITDTNLSVQRAGLAEGEGGRDPYTEWAFEDFFHEDGLMLESSQVMSSLYHCAVVSHSVTEPKTDSSLHRLIAAVLPVVTLLKDNGHLSLAVQYYMDTVTTIAQCVASETVGFTDVSQPTQNSKLLQTMMSESLSELTQMTSSLLMKVLGQWPVDHALGVGLLCCLPHRLALDLLQKTTKRIGHRYKHILAVVRVGKDYASLCGDQKTFDVYELLELDAFWGHKLAKCKVSFKSVFCVSLCQVSFKSVFCVSFKGVFGLSHLEKSQLLPQVCRSANVTVTDIRQYCSDYLLEEEGPLMMHLNHLIQQCATVSPGGTASLVADNSHVTSLLSSASELIEGFHNTELLLRGLEKMLTQIDPYDYTRLGFVLEQMSHLSSEPSVKMHQKLLHFLYEYKRVAPISPYECNYSSGGDRQLVIEDTVVPEVAHTRLPFHPLAFGAPWKIISPELDVDTLSVWLPIVFLLELSTDQLYVTAVNNIVHKHLEAVKRTRHSQCQSASPEGAVDASFLDTVHSFLCNITDVQLAVGCSNWVVKELPLGEEKVAAAKWNMDQSLKWLEAATTGLWVVAGDRLCCVVFEDTERENRKEIHRKIFERYRRLTTEQVLAANQLTQPDLLQLTTSPAKLIFHLYQHYSVLTQSLGSRVMCQPDINKIADKIAHANQVNIKKIQLNLIEKWFRSTSQAKQDDLDITLDVTICQTDDMDETEAESNLMRYVYSSYDMGKQGRENKLQEMAES